MKTIVPMPLGCFGGQTKDIKALKMQGIIITHSSRPCFLLRRWLLKQRWQQRHSFINSLFIQEMPIIINNMSLTIIFKNPKTETKANAVPFLSGMKSGCRYNSLFWRNA
jgi:hypothetical protein